MLLTISTRQTKRYSKEFMDLFSSSPMHKLINIPFYMVNQIERIVNET